MKVYQINYLAPGFSQDSRIFATDLAAYDEVFNYLKGIEAVDSTLIKDYEMDNEFNVYDALQDSFLDYIFSSGLNFSFGVEGFASVTEYELEGLERIKKLREFWR